MKREQRAAVHRGTIFRYCPNFRCMLEDNGTGVRYLDLPGRTWGVNSGIAEQFSFILQAVEELGAIAHSSSAIVGFASRQPRRRQPFTDHAVHARQYACGQPTAVMPRNTARRELPAVRTPAVRRVFCILTLYANNAVVEKNCLISHRSALGKSSSISEIKSAANIGQASDPAYRRRAS
ncbi:MAG: hypothetical protein K0R28_6765 [Paenibacillus sp.]|jgi:hypothetical protein|nr:hypothetical protein [Paenibacillus sp.]